MQLLYLDQVDLGHLNVPLWQYPRVEAYLKHDLTDLIALDEIDKQHFGKKPVSKHLQLLAMWQSSVAAALTLSTYTYRQEWVRQLHLWMS